MADFSNNIVNQRFRTLYDELYRQGHIRGKSDIAEKLGTYNHVINSILKGQRNITIEQLSKLFEHYQANANYLFGLSNKMFLKGAPGAGSIPTLSIDAPSFAGRQNIVLVPDRAMAGYALQHQDADFLDGLQHFSIPNLEGELIAFEISGDSMMPTITNGDLVVCESLERGSQTHPPNSRLESGRGTPADFGQWSGVQTLRSRIGGGAPDSAGQMSPHFARHRLGASATAAASCGPVSSCPHRTKYLPFFRGPDGELRRMGTSPVGLRSGCFF